MSRRRRRSGMSASSGGPVCSPSTILTLAGGVATVVLVVVTGAALLVFRNLYGPFGESSAAGIAVAFSTGLVAAGSTYLLMTVVARRSALAAGGLVLLLAATGWVLVPQRVDVSESWVPRPNERYACTGWRFWSYPPGTMDGSSTAYCIGFEERIPSG